MSSTIIAFTLELVDGSKIGPHWTLDAAVESARQVEAAPGGRKARRICRGADIVMEGDLLRQKLSE